MEIDRKRPSDGPVSEAKRPSVDPSGPVTADDIEQFQKDALYRELVSCKRERDELQAQLDASQLGDEAIRSELNALTEKYIAASKRAERLASPIVSRVMQTGPTDHSSLTAGEASGNSGGAGPPTGGAATGAGAPGSSGTGDASGNTSSGGSEASEILELKSKLAAAQGEVEKTREFIAIEDKKRQDLESKLREIDEKMASAPANAQVTETRLKEAHAETRRLAAEARALQQQISDLKANQAEYEGKVRERHAANVTSLESRLTAAEADVLRIRTARDELLSEINILKAENAEHRNEANRLKELVDLGSVNDNNANDHPNGSSANSAGASTLDTADNLPGDADGLRERCLALIRQNKALSDEISGLEQGFTRASAKAKAAVKATAAAEQKVGVLNTAKVRSDEKYIGAMRARDSLSQELQRTKAALSKSAEVVSDLKAQEQRLTAQLSRLQKQAAQNEVLLQQRKHETDTIRRGKQEVDGLLATMRLGSEKLREQLAQRDVEKSAADLARRNAETEVEKLKRQLETQRAISGLGSSSDVQEQLESLRSIAMCPVCQKNWKDRALTTCGHTLCDECVQNRLTARMRKCPMCNGHFASNDVLTIHL